MKKVILNLLIILAIIYLVVSAKFVYSYIDFEPKPEVIIAGMEVADNNAMRIFMGLPPAMTTYHGVPPTYIFKVRFKLILAMALVVLLVKINIKNINNKDKETKQENKQETKQET